MNTFRIYIILKEGIFIKSILIIQPFISLTRKVGQDMGKKKGQGNHQLQASSSTTTVWRATDGGRGVSARGKGFETAFADGSDGRFESLPAGYATSRYAVLTKESSRNDADLGNLDDEDAYDSGSDDPIQEEQSSVAIRKRSISVRLCMWEFGQNDPKRDSGVKLRRMGFADSLKLGQSFPGVDN